MKRAAVLLMLDGWGTPVCHYKQSKGMCQGVSMEWLRRVILKGKETLYSRDPSAEKVGKKGNNYTKEGRWDMTQKGIYDLDNRKAAALLHDQSTSGVLFGARKELLALR
jgi:hypothetical protein